MRMVPIFAKIVMEELGRNYRKYFEYLLNWEFLITDNHYRPAKTNPAGWGKAKCWGFTDKYFGKPMVNYEIKKKSLLKRFRKRNDKSIENIKNDPVLYQHKTFLDKLTFDFDGAIDKLRILRLNKNLTQNEHDIEVNRCEKIRDKNFYIVRDDAGRIHTNLTNISKIIRENFFYIDGVKRYFQRFLMNTNYIGYSYEYKTNMFGNILECRVNLQESV